jgi:hypothetical protein
MKFSVRVVRAIAVCLFVGAQVEQAKAQAGLAPENQPAVSPWLQMLRSGGSPTLNYYGIVRPEFSFMNAAGSLQQQVSNNQQAITQAASSTTTGHGAMFMNLGGYFQRIGGTAPGGAGGGAIAPLRANQGLGGFGQGGLGNINPVNAGGFGGGGAFAPQAPIRQ